MQSYGWLKKKNKKNAHKKTPQKKKEKQVKE